MPVKHHHRGTGLTKESRVHIKLSKPPTKEEADAVKRMFRQIGAVATFEGKVEFAEIWAIDTLESAGLTTDGRATVKEVQSFPWYANKILCDLNLIRKIKARVTAGKGDEADPLALFSLKLGALLYEIGFKLDWEPHTLYGIESQQHRKMGGDAAKRAKDQRNEFLRQEADKYRQKGRTSNAEIARHIRKRAKKEIERVNDPDADRKAIKAWTDIDRLSPSTIRKIIA